MKKLKFDLVVEANALQCPNPEIFYSKCYITEDVADNYRIISGVKSASKVANMTFTNVLKAANCQWSAVDSELDAIDVDVCPIRAMVQICQYDLETSFLANMMRPGVNSPLAVQPFMDYYWDELSKEVAEEVAILRWRGNTAGATDTFLDLCDGYEKKFLADASIVDVTATTVTASNVLAQMALVYAALPAACKFKTNSLRFYVSANVAAAYQAAVAVGNTIAYITKALDLTYLGIKIVIAEGMSNNRMVLTVKDNLLYVTDSVDDAQNIKAIWLDDVLAEPVLRSNVNLKVGFYYTNPTQIVYYN